MGGNANYRYRTAVYTDSEGNRHTVKDANGNNIEIPEFKYTNRQTKKLNAFRVKNRSQDTANAHERMMNAKALKQVRDIAKQYRSFSKKWDGNVPMGGEVDEFLNDLDKATDNLETLAKLANQIKPGTVDLKNYSLGDARRAIEKVLGVKLS